MNHDLATKIKAVADVSSGDTIDLAGAESVALIMNTKATTAVTLTEGSDSGGSGATAVAAANIIVGDDDGVKASNVVTYSETGTALIGYVGKERYLTVTVANAADDATIVEVLGDLHNRPTQS